MEKQLSSIQISKQFKEILRREKQKGESFEDYIGRLRQGLQSIDVSIEEKQSIDDKPSTPKVKKEIKSFDKLSDFNMEVLSQKLKEGVKQKQKISNTHFPLPKKIQENLDKEKLDDPEIPMAEPNFETRSLPWKSPGEIIQHQKSFSRFAT